MLWQCNLEQARHHFGLTKTIPVIGDGFCWLYSIITLLALLPKEESWRTACLEADKYGPEVDRTVTWVQQQALQFIAQNWRDLDNYFHKETPQVRNQEVSIQKQVIDLFRNFIINRRRPNAIGAILVLVSLFQCTIIAWTPPRVREVWHVSRRQGAGKSCLPDLEYARGYDHNAYRAVQVYQHNTINNSFKVSIVDPMLILQRPGNYPRQLHIEYDSASFHWSPMLRQDESNIVPLPSVVHKLWNEFSKQGFAIKRASNQIKTLQGTIVDLNQELVKARAENLVSFNSMEAIVKSQAELNVEQNKMHAKQNKMQTELMISMQKKMDNLL